MKNISNPEFWDFLTVDNGQHRNNIKNLTKLQLDNYYEKLSFKKSKFIGQSIEGESSVIFVSDKIVIMRLKNAICYIDGFGRKSNPSIDAILIFSYGIQLRDKLLSLNQNSYVKFRGTIISFFRRNVSETDYNIPPFKDQDGYILGEGLPKNLDIIPIHLNLEFIEESTPPKSWWQI